MDLNTFVDETLTNSDKIIAPSGKLVRFSYEQSAYDENEIAGTSEYSYTEAQNIPLGTSADTYTSNNILSKGFRAQASSISRNLINHFLGRTSYNLNKIHDWFNGLLQNYKRHLAQDDNLYSETATYKTNDVCFVLDDLTEGEGIGAVTRRFIRQFRCIAAQPITDTPPIKLLNGEKVVDTENWAECNVFPLGVYGSKFYGSATDVDDGIITTDKLADASVTTDKIANSAITKDKLAENVREFIVDSYNPAKQWEAKNDKLTHWKVQSFSTAMSGIWEANGKLYISAGTKLYVTDNCETFNELTFFEGKAIKSILYTHWTEDDETVSGLAIVTSDGGYLWKDKTETPVEKDFLASTGLLIQYSDLQVIANPQTDGFYAYTEGSVIKISNTLDTATVISVNDDSGETLTLLPVVTDKSETLYSFEFCYLQGTNGTWAFTNGEFSRVTKQNFPVSRINGQTYCGTSILFENNAGQAVASKVQTKVPIFTDYPIIPIGNQQFLHRYGLLWITDAYGNRKPVYSTTTKPENSFEYNENTDKSNYLENVLIGATDLWLRGTVPNGTHSLNYRALDSKGQFTAVSLPDSAGVSYNGIGLAKNGTDEMIWYSASNGASIFYSTDKGITWEERVTPVSNDAVTYYAESANLFALVTIGRKFYYSNLGTLASWQDGTEEFDTIIQLYATNSVIYVVTTNSDAYSIDYNNGLVKTPILQGKNIRNIGSIQGVTVATTMQNKLYNITTGNEISISIEDIANHAVEWVLSSTPSANNTYGLLRVYTLNGWSHGCTVYELAYNSGTESIIATPVASSVWNYNNNALNIYKKDNKPVLLMHDNSKTLEITLPELQLSVKDRVIKSAKQVGDTVYENYETDYPCLTDVNGVGTWYREYFSNWTAQTSGTTAALKAIAYGNGLFVATGSSRTILTSTDGKSWTSQTTTIASGLRSIAYGNGIFVAVIGDGTIYTSTNGKSWTAQSSGVTSYLEAVGYGNGLFVIAGTAGTTGSGYVLTSTDGISWTQTNGTTHEPTSVVYCDNFFILTGRDGYMAKSTDGISWAKIQLNTTTGIFGVAYGNGIFVAVGAGGTILTSTDGNSWTAQSSGTPLTLLSVVYGKGIFVVVGSTGAGRIVLASTNGNSWATQPSGVSVYLAAITYAENLFIIVGSNGTILTADHERAIKQNNISYELPDEITSVSAMAYGNETLLLASDSDVYATKDMRSMEKYSVANSHITKLLFDKDHFLAITSDGTGYTSKYGYVWKSIGTVVSAGYTLVDTGSIYAQVKPSKVSLFGSAAYMPNGSQSNLHVKECALSFANNRTAYSDVTQFLDFAAEDSPLWSNANYQVSTISNVIEVDNRLYAVSNDGVFCIDYQTIAPSVPNADTLSGLIASDVSSNIAENPVVKYSDKTATATNRMLKVGNKVLANYIQDGLATAIIGNKAVIISKEAIKIYDDRTDKVTELKTENLGLSDCSSFQVIASGEISGELYVIFKADNKNFMLSTKDCVAISDPRLTISDNNLIINSGLYKTEQSVSYKRSDTELVVSNLYAN